MLIAVTKSPIFPSAMDAADVYDDHVSLAPVRVRVCRNGLNLCYLHTYFWVEWSDPIFIIILIISVSNSRSRPKPRPSKISLTQCPVNDIFVRSKTAV